MRASSWTASTRLWLARALIGSVCAWNIQCAVAFLAAPGTYAPGFDLAGFAGTTTVRGLGVLFLMWNVPYLSAVVHPVAHRLSLDEAVVMQAIGLVGESLLRCSLGGAHPGIAPTLGRFAAFDAAGLLLLACAAGLTRGDFRRWRATGGV